MALSTLLSYIPMEHKVVECNECHYEFNYVSSTDDSFPVDFPKIVRCPECGVGSNIDNIYDNRSREISSHNHHTASGTGIKIWLTMLGPIILLAFLAFLSMPLLRLNFFFYLSGMVVVALLAWTIAALYSFLISKYQSSAEVVLNETEELNSL